MANYIYIAASLDGYIATSDGGVDWLNEMPNPVKGDFSFPNFMSGIDAIVMGRKTLEQVLSFGSWPYTKPVFVLSRKGVKIPEQLEKKAEVVNADPKTLTKQLKEKGFYNLYIDGGITIQSFLEDDLIDEMIVTRVPVLLGAGIPLFGKLPQRRYFSHRKTEVLNNMLVISHYSREESEAK